MVQQRFIMRGSSDFVNEDKTIEAKMTGELHTGPLGESSQYAEGYKADHLFPMPREEGRQAVGLADAPPWFGVDVWTGYEFSWLDERGKPRVAVLRVSVTAKSSHIVESKSMKLYLNGFAQTRFMSDQEVVHRLSIDLGQAVRGEVGIEMIELDDQKLNVQPLDGYCLDQLDIQVDDYQRNADLLCLAQDESVDASVQAVTEQLTTHLFRSLCPVTAQPDWASIVVRYTGPPLHRAGLLKYLVSYRGHQAFHETTIERIYADIWQRCQPVELEVCGYFLRRGGLDISPRRSSDRLLLDNRRLGRQ